MRRTTTLTGRQARWPVACKFSFWWRESSVRPSVPEGSEKAARHRLRPARLRPLTGVIRRRLSRIIGLRTLARIEGTPIGEAVILTRRARPIALAARLHSTLTAGLRTLTIRSRGNLFRGPFGLRLRG